MKEIAVIHARKRYIEGHEHLNGEVGVFNAHSEDILGEALKFSRMMGKDGIHNYTVVAIVLLSYPHADATVWTSTPTHEVCRWELSEEFSLGMQAGYREGYAAAERVAAYRASQAR